MDSGYWRRIEVVLDAALDSDPTRWPAVLDELCGGDVALRSDAEDLLSRYSSLRRFLDTPPSAAAAALVTEARSRAHGDAYDGKRIGPYRIVRELGRGGMSRVFLAERADGAFEQRVALKLLRPGLDSDIDHNRFRVERQILATLNHPHIARLLDGGVTDEGVPYLVLEYVDGKPIDAYCNERALSARQRLTLFLSVVEATQHAHRSLVVHRDLKPSNILVTADGVVKLLDFGLAKLLEPGIAVIAERAAFSTNRWMTPAYAAPEQLTGSPVTTLTDVYQLGAVLYELLAGEPPFGRHAATLHQLGDAILQAEPATPSTVAPAERRSAIRGDVDAIVLRALRKEPERRYAAPQAMAEDISRFLSGYAVLARQPTIGYRARRFARRHRLALAAATAMVAVLGAYVTTVIVDRRHIKGALAEATLGARRAEQVTEFMLGLFEESESGKAFGDTITARALLLRGIRRAHEPSAQPALKAQMLDVVGRLEAQLGQIDRALPLLREALDIRRELHGDYHTDVATSLQALAQVNYEKGDFRAALEGRRQVLDIRSRLGGESDPKTTRALFELAAAMHGAGDYRGAQPLMERWAALIARQAPETSATRANELMHLGLVYEYSGRLDRAEQLLREAIDINRSLYGSEHKLVAMTELHLAGVMEKQRQPAEAERLLRRAVATMRANYPEGHLDLAYAMRLLAVVLNHTARYDEALVILRESNPMARRLAGEQSQNYLDGLLEQVFAMSMTGDSREAEPLARQVLSGVRAKFGDTSLLTLRARIPLAETLRGQGRFAEAESELLAVYAAVKDRSGFATRSREGVLNALVRLYEAKGQMDEAAKYQALKSLQPVVAK